MGILDFFSPEAGRARNEWKREREQEFLGLLGEVFGPQAATVESAARVGQMLNPVSGVAEAMQGGRQAYEGRGWDRVAGVGRAASGVAGTVAPLAIAGSGAADDATKAVADALLGWSPARQGAADEFGRFAADESGAIRAFHGSPHDFDRFQMDKIGTGEGAQAYGHGLYFAENEGVARSYQESLAQAITVDGRPLLVNNRQVGSTGDESLDDLLIAHNGDLDAAIADERAFADEMAAEGKVSRRYGGDPYEGVRKLEELRGRVQSANSGRLYEVNINADPEDFLDWDAPLSEGMLWDIGDGLSGSMDRAEEELSDFFRYSVLPGDMTGREAYMWLGNTFGKDEMPDGVFSLPERAGAEYAARALKDAGIPGIRYRDAGSRGLDGQEGTRNYVVFDENLIEIVRKYGIAGAAAMLGMSAADVQAAVGQPQGLLGGGW